MHGPGAARFQDFLVWLGQTADDLIDEWVARLANQGPHYRLRAGFPLSDVHKAFELSVSSVIERLRAPELAHLLAASVEPINQCLAFTIHRFSDLFQQIAEAAIRSHAQGLERTGGCAPPSWPRVSSATRPL